MTIKKQFAIIDIETTGGSAHREKITEIAIVVYDGEKIITEYESLVNPERSIPPFITKLTGITNEMVKNAPKFYEIAKDIVEATEDTVFVAHNVRFDYGFVQEEFKRLGYHFSRNKLCTVRMSRTAFPGLRSYSLGNLIKHFNIKVEGRHRAMEDVRATLEVFKKIQEVNESQKDKDFFIKHSMKNINLPEAISHTQVLDLPESTGVYYFFDKDDKIIYVGKSINIRKRIKQHFQNINPKSNKLYNRAVKISYELTGSEMLAFLLENEEIKKYQPDINRASRSRNFGVFIHYFINPEGYLTFEIENNNISNRKNKQILSEHANVMSAKSALNFLKHEHELCSKLIGLENGEGPCFDFGINACQGACVLKEDPDSYNERALMASYRANDIHPQNLILIDKGRTRDEIAVALVYEGNYHGYQFFDKDFTSFSHEEILEFIPKKKRYPDQNNIIKRFLNNQGGIKIIPF